MEKFNEKPFEPSPEVIAQVVSVEAQISELKDRIAALGRKKSDLVSDEARRRAQLKPGDIVQAFYRRKLTPHRITQVTGCWYSIQTIYRIMIEYVGQPQLKKGYGDEERLFPEQVG